MSKKLAPHEEERCVEFLHRLGVREPGHRLLSDRGYFGIFLCGLSPDELNPSDDYHPSMVEFRATIRLLAVAGIENLKVMLVERLPAEDPPQAIPDTPSCRPAPRFQKDIKPVHPTNEHKKHRMDENRHALSSRDAINVAAIYAGEGRFHDAYHVISEYLHDHPLDENLIVAAVDTIRGASVFDRAHAIPPFNMLYECEELAAILAKRIPEMFHVRGPTDAQTRTLYRAARSIYHCWCDHARALLEYKYKTDNDEWLKRNWLDPRDFGFLLDIMSAAVRSRLTLDLLRFVLGEIRGCIAIGMGVIAHEEKQAKFEGDLLRIIASPTKDVVPDLTFDIYREIVRAYIREGDTQSALLFCKQCLFLRHGDVEMAKLKAELSELGAERMRRKC